MINKDKIESLLEQLENNKYIQIISKELHEPISNWVLDDFKSRKIQFSDSILDFHKEIDGCNIEWECNLDAYPEIEKYHEDDTILRGKIHIRKLFYALAPNHTLVNQYKEHFEEDEVGDLIKFRQISINDDYTRVGFFKENGFIDTSLYFLLADANGFSEAPTKFEDFLNAMLDNLGIIGWEYEFLFQNEEYENFVHHYKEQLGLITEKSKTSEEE